MKARASPLYPLLAKLLSLPRLTHIFFFFNDTATTEIYTLSLHDALPISKYFPRPRAEGPHPRHHRPPQDSLRCQARSRYDRLRHRPIGHGRQARRGAAADGRDRDRKSTRLNSSHSSISYAVFCLKKKKKQ